MPKPLTQTTGRRKAAVARVRLRPYEAASPADGGGASVPGAPVPTDETPAAPEAATEPGHVVINGRPIENYFPSATQRMVVTEPLRLTDTAQRYLVEASIDGGGVSGQAGALRLGIARALAELDPDLRIPLKRAGLLTRDAREKESKKYGLKKARKAPQYSKR